MNVGPLRRDARPRAVDARELSAIEVNRRCGRGAANLFENRIGLECKFELPAVRSEFENASVRTLLQQGSARIDRRLERLEIKNAGIAPSVCGCCAAGSGQRK